jgi:DNA-binding response OmpR family regulator
MHNDVVAARKRVMVISHRRRSGLELADWLASDGYEVTIVHKADEAIEQLSAMRPDGIILDLHLPIACGLEMLRLIRLQSPQVPVFTIEESTCRADTEVSYHAGESPYCLRPFQHPLMNMLLDAHVRDSRPRA